LIPAGALPQIPLGKLTALPRLPSWILGAYFYGRVREERGEKGGSKGVEKERGGPQSYC